MEYLWLQNVPGYLWVYGRLRPPPSPDGGGYTARLEHWRFLLLAHLGRGLGSRAGALPLFWGPGLVSVGRRPPPYRCNKACSVMLCGVFPIQNRARRHRSHVLRARQGPAFCNRTFDHSPFLCVCLCRRGSAALGRSFGAVFSCLANQFVCAFVPHRVGEHLPNHSNYMSSITDT